MADLKKFRFWCQKVLPLVYDESLSYYEVLCKCVHYINSMIDDLSKMGEDVTALRTDVDALQKWVDSFEDLTVIGETIEKWLTLHMASMIFPELTDTGYIAYNIPESWDDITFFTTGLDINVDLMPEYGHLILAY